MKRFVEISLVLAVWLLAVQLPAFAQRKAGASDVAAQQAAAAFRQGQMTEALRLYDVALADRTLGNERRANILTDRGVVRERVGRVTEAVADFNQAIKLFPEFPVAYNNRGALLVRIGAFAEAMKDFNRALQLAPGYAAAYSNRAGALVKLKQYDEAISSYTTAIRLTPAIVEPLAGRAGVYIAQQRPRAALRDLTRAIATDARFSLGYRQRAAAYLELEEYSSAAADLSRAIAFDAANAEFYLARGKAYMRGNDPAAAMRDFTKAIELRPGFSEAFLERGHAGILLEQFEQAEQDLAKAIELQPTAALGYAYRALMYKKLGQPELGAQEVNKALVLNAKSARVLWAKGEIDEALSRPEDAAEAYRKALSIAPQMQNAVFGLKRLGEVVEDETEEFEESSFENWRVFGLRGKFHAANDELGNIRVPLEVAGDGVPRILGWELQEGEFRDIGLLRFSAGKIEIEGKSYDNEFIAIVDVRAQSVKGIEPHRQGRKVSKWSWGSGRVVVAALDGLTQEYVLRKPRQTTVSQRRQPASRYRNENASPHWAPWLRNDTTRARPSSRRSRRQSRRRPKTLFDLLLGN